MRHASRSVRVRSLALTTKATCPYCGFDECEAEFVHNGLGMEQVTPYVCGACEARQIGPFDGRTLTENEKRTGWYEPPQPTPEQVEEARRLIDDIFRQ